MKQFSNQEIWMLEKECKKTKKSVFCKLGFENVSPFNFRSFAAAGEGVPRGLRGGGSLLRRKTKDNVHEKKTNC